MKFSLFKRRLTKYFPDDVIFQVVRQRSRVFQPKMTAISAPIPESGVNDVVKQEKAVNAFARVQDSTGTDGL